MAFNFHHSKPSSICEAVAHKHWTTAHMQSGYGQISAKTRRLLSDHSELGLVHFALLWRGGWVERESAEDFFMLKSKTTWNGKPTNFKFWNKISFFSRSLAITSFCLTYDGRKWKLKSLHTTKIRAQYLLGILCLWYLCALLSWRSPAAPWASTSFLICGRGFGLMLSLP